jgi:hypothetical protein
MVVSVALMTRDEDLRTSRNYFICMTPAFLLRNQTLLKGLAAVLICCSFVTESRAGLTWEKKQIELTSPVGAAVIRTAYCFTNTGKTPITVIAIKPSCGCVATALEKFDYAPGEGGQIKVTFDLGMEEFAKLQKRTIAVTTSDAPKSPTVLKLRVHVPETVSVSPEAVIWHRGEKPATKEAVVKAGSGVAAIKLIQATSNSNFTVEVKPEVAGRRYRLKITPLNTGAPAYASLKFKVESASFTHRVVCEVQLNVE